MKKILLLFSFLLLASVSVQAEVFPSVDDDVGVEQMLFSVDSAISVDLVSVDNSFKTVLFSVANLANESHIIDASHYVSTFSNKQEDQLERTQYKYIYTDEIYTPPLLASYNSLNKRT